MREHNSQKILYTGHVYEVDKIPFHHIFTLPHKCCTIASSIYYTKGTQCLDRGEYDQAVIDLKKAVELNPQFARNHMNLSAAYLSVGDIVNAWIHSRLSRICHYGDPLTEIQFQSMWEMYVYRRGYDTLGLSIEEVLAGLGEPDMSMHTPVSTKIILIYGSYIMVFEDDKLVQTKLCKLYE